MLASPLKKQKLLKDQYSPALQSLGKIWATALSLALLVINAKKAICLAIIKLLLASQLRGRSVPGPAEDLKRVEEGVPPHSSEMPTQD